MAAESNNSIALQPLGAPSLIEPHRESSKTPTSQRGDMQAKSLWLLISVGLGLLTISIFSILVLSSSIRSWTFSDKQYQFITSNRASVQLMIQLLANGLSLTTTAILCHLFNRAFRIRWNKKPASLNSIRLWNGLCVRSVDWSIPLRLLFPLIAFILFTAAPAAVWVGALTPVTTATSNPGVFQIPAYRHTASIKEWPSEIGKQGPFLNTEHGLFSYSVGLNMQASLITSASSAITIDGSRRQHVKLDNTGFTYSGRSYGVGASVGLQENSIEQITLQSHRYLETGFVANVSCIYNSSSTFKLIETGDNFLYRAYGKLPNSGTIGPEDSTYLGHDTDAMLAIGVGRNPSDPRRMLAIAAGKHYAHLNNAQCSFTFEPTEFYVSVYFERNRPRIFVTPGKTLNEFYPGASTLTQTVMRQFQTISVAQTTLYVSLLGNAFNKSITDYVTAATHQGRSLSFDDAVLPALENALTVMVDDMLVAYASAQFMVQKDTQEITADIVKVTFRVGQDLYIFFIFAFNAAIIVVVVEEAVRTRNWRDLPAVDFLDPGALMVRSAASAAGEGKVEMKGLTSRGVEARLDEGERIVLEVKGSLLADAEATGA